MNIQEFRFGEYVLTHDNGTLTAMHYGDSWPTGTLVSDGLTLALFQDYAELARKVTYLDKLLPQVTSITDYLSANRLGVWGGDSLPCALELIKKHVPLPGATIELNSLSVVKLADRLATAVCGDRQIEGFDVELLSQGVTGSRLSALIVEMAGHEAEAYALQDQVDEANSSVTALEQRIAELEAAIREVIHPRAPQERISIKRHQAMCQVLTLLEGK